MGQVTSRISDYFSDNSNATFHRDPPDIQNKEGGGIFSKYIKRTVRFRDINEDWSFTSRLTKSFDSLATPRAPLKRSRSFSVDLSLPDSIHQIFLPSKRSRIDKEDEYLDFPFLVDSKTISFYRNSKIMIILRGLPGSGKSEIANRIKNKFVSSVVCSADLFFMKDGKYDYDRSLIGEAHKSSQHCAVDAALNQAPVIVIDNSAIMLWEIKFYFDLAKAYGYITVVVEPRTPWKRDVAVLAHKNFHNISQDILLAKNESFEEFKPYYFGWFLNDKDSHLLLEEARAWLEKAWQDKFFKKHIHSSFGIHSLTELVSFFKKTGKELTLHCTAKFIGRDLSEENKEYIEKITNSVGKMYEIEVIGFVLTPRTFGARVKLSTEQLNLWAMNDNEEIPELYWEVPVTDNGNKNDGSIDDQFNGFVSMDDLTNDVVKNSDSNRTNGSIDNGEIITNGSNEQVIGSISNDNKSLNGDSLFIEDGISINSTVDVSFSLSNLSGSIDSITPSPSKSFDDLFSHNSSTNCNSGESITSLSLGENDQQLITNGSQETDMDTLTSSSEGVLLSNASFSPSKRLGGKFAGPRKGARSVPIPPNKRSPDESTTRSTLSYEPVDSSDHGFLYTPTSGIGSRAHFTLGCAPGISAVTTGFDLIMAIGLEGKAFINYNDGIQIPDDFCNGSESNSSDVPSEVDPDSELREPQESPPSKNELRDKRSTLNSMKSNNKPAPLKFPVHIIKDEEGEIRNYGYGIWVFYPSERLSFSSVFSAWA